MALRIETTENGYLVRDTQTNAIEGPMSWDDAIRRVGRLILQTTIEILMWEGQTL